MQAVNRNPYLGDESTRMDAYRDMEVRWPVATVDMVMNCCCIQRKRSIYGRYHFHHHQIMVVVWSVDYRSSRRLPKQYYVAVKRFSISVGAEDVVLDDCCCPNRWENVVVPILSEHHHYCYSVVHPNLHHGSVDSRDSAFGERSWIRDCPIQHHKEYR